VTDFAEHPTRPALIDLFTKMGVEHPDWLADFFLEQCAEWFWAGWAAGKESGIQRMAEMVAPWN
jgi:hypothetical protein